MTWRLRLAKRLIDRGGALLYWERQTIQPTSAAVDLLAAEDHMACARGYINLATGRARERAR